MQKESILARHDGQTGRVHVEVLPGPYLGQANSIIPTKINDRRIEQVRAKFAHHQRGNADIAVFGTNFIGRLWFELSSVCPRPMLVSIVAAERANPYLPAVTWLPGNIEANLVLGLISLSCRREIPTASL
jgi:hypothetical protein